MPLYFVASVVTLRTVPTGSRVGSAAAIPDRTSTPEAVVVPLQYPVAANCRRVPVTGAVGSITAPPAANSRESNVVASYSKTKVATANNVAMTFSPIDPESRPRAFIGIHRAPPGHHPPTPTPLREPDSSGLAAGCEIGWGVGR